MKQTNTKRALSLLLSMLLAVSGMLPAFSAFAEDDGVINKYNLQIFYEDGTMVPTYAENGTDEYVEYMEEGATLQLTYQVIGRALPDNATIKWYSQNPILVDVDQNGKVKAFDSSKGAVIQSWINNEVKPIKIIGSPLATALEKVFFYSDDINVDDLDTDAIQKIVLDTMGEDSFLSDYVEAYSGQLMQSLAEYLDKVNTPIYCQLYDASGELLAEDYVNVTVKKPDPETQWWTNFLPNGTHITNKSQIKTTQAVGNTVQLYAITTPQRLKLGTVYSVKSSSIFTQGKVVATVNDSGLVTFKNAGTCTILVSPDSEDVIELILKMVNYVYALDNTGTLDTNEIAGYMIDYMGLDINRTVLAGLLDAAFAVKDIAQDAADPVQLTATAVEIIANLVLQMVYNDTIDFTVVPSEPITNFNIDGATSVKEGTEIQLDVIDVEPDAADKSVIQWSSSDPTIAKIDPSTGVIKGLDARGSLGDLSTQNVMIYARVYNEDGSLRVEKNREITVVGKTGRFISDVQINGPDTVEIDTSASFSHMIYPSRVADGKNLYWQWGLVNGEDEDGNPIYIWTTDEITEVSNGIGKINNKGVYTTLKGGTSQIALRAYTGYYLSNGNFFEVSSYTATKEILTGIPVESIQIATTGGTSSINGDIDTTRTVTINGETYTYSTITKTNVEAYNGNGAKLSATVYPANATNKDVKWVVDNEYYNTSDLSDDTHSVSVKQKAGHEVADAFNVYAVSEDGKVKSNTITVCICKNPVTANVINEDSVTVTKVTNTDKDGNLEPVAENMADVTHTISFTGGSTDTGRSCYKCNWYSSDESVCTVSPKGNTNRDGVVTGWDVGTATVYCVSSDGGFMDSITVTVLPDKSFLKEVIELCENTVIRKTDENKNDYKQYMKKLGLARSLYREQTMASQTTVDTYAEELLTAFYKLGGFVSLNELYMRGPNKSALSSKFITVKVGSTTNYTKYSYDLDYEAKPRTAMFSDVRWTSSDSKISVDSNGVCTPTSNDPCAAKITCTVTDYRGKTKEDYVYVAFARTAATGVSLDTTTIAAGKVGEKQQITATASPTNAFGNSSASCKDYLIWTSEDESIATVDANGEVTFVAGGSTNIVCTTMDGGYSAACAVTVVTNYDALQKLIQKYTDLDLRENAYYPDTWDVYAAAMSKAQTMVSHGGYSQKEVNAMEATLQAAYEQLREYKFLHGVELYHDGEALASDFYQYDVNIIAATFNMKNAKLQLNVILDPVDADYLAPVEWTSSTSDLSVTSNGEVSPTANKACYGMITCTVKDHFYVDPASGEPVPEDNDEHIFSDSVWVSFAYVPVTALVLSDESVNGSIGGTYQLSCTVEPTGRVGTIGAASIKDYYWESDNEDVCTVDQNGLIRFTGAGLTKVRAVSYDGGIKGECTVSTEGDRNALNAAIEQYKDVNYQDYEVAYGTAFKTAYEAAVAAMTDMTLNQTQIDTVTANLTNAGAALAGHPYPAIADIQVSWQGYNNGSNVFSGTIGASNALSIDLYATGLYNSYNYKNSATLTARAVTKNGSTTTPKTIAWSVNNTSDMDTSIDGTSVTLTPQGDAWTDANRNKAGWAKVTITATDDYGRVTKKTVDVVMADKTVTGISLNRSAIENAYATDGAQTVTATVSQTTRSAASITNVEWSSSDENVATVSGGVISFVDKGECVITARTVDGGYTATVNVSVMTDFRPLAEKVTEYKAVINNISEDDLVYTADSLSTLRAALAESESVLTAGNATQAEVYSYLDTLNAAYDGLVRYVAAESITITVPGNQSNVTIPSEGYVRYTAESGSGLTDNVLTNKTINLGSIVSPDGALYRSIEWTSSNNLVTVDSTADGDDTTVIVKTLAGAQSAKITAAVTTYDNETFVGSINVSFTQYPVTAVTFEEEYIFGAPNETYELQPDLHQNLPDLSSYSAATQAAMLRALEALHVDGVTYQSLDESIATVNENGIVTFHSYGRTQIVATAADGGIQGVIDAYTTNDTSALKAAITQADAIDYMNYEYSTGMAFKAVRDYAKVVYNTPTATQDSINLACTNLEEAITGLEGNEFVFPNPTVTVNGETVVSGATYEVDANQQATVAYTMNDGAMITSSAMTVEDVSGATVSQSGSTAVITKTADKATMVIKVTTVDTYARENTFTYAIKLADGVTMISDIAISSTTAGAQITGDSITYHCGGSYSNLPSDGLQLVYERTPEGASDPVSVQWSITAATPRLPYMNINASTGLITFTTRGTSALVSEYTETATCKITNADGTTVTKTIAILIVKQ